MDSQIGDEITDSELDSQIVEAVTKWETISFSGGYGGLGDLSVEEFSGAIQANNVWAFMLNGRIIRVVDGSLSAFESAEGTAYKAPDPSLPLLYTMQSGDSEKQAEYYTEETPISEANATLSEGDFTGYIELSENVLSGDYYLIYYVGRPMSVAFVGNARRLLTGDEAFKRADDEVGIYSVFAADIDVVDIPSTPSINTVGSKITDAANNGSATVDADTDINKSQNSMTASGDQSSASTRQRSTDSTPDTRANDGGTAPSIGTEPDAGTADDVNNKSTGGSTAVTDTAQETADHQETVERTNIATNTETDDSDEPSFEDSVGETSTPANSSSMYSNSREPTAKSSVPELSAVASPPRRSLTYEDLEISENLIGAGGQAVVHEATLDESDNPTKVALKEPKHSGTLTTEIGELFLQEATTWKTIDQRERQKPRWSGYEHIVGVIDTGEVHLPWIAMEYMDGGNLADRIESTPEGLPVNQALWIGECLCRGLEIADEYGYSHLDVKPKNILFRETPKEVWDVPKLADWGVARTLADETGTMETKTVTYSAPEQFDPGEYGDPDSLTDLYQVGAVVYVMLTGERPYTGSNTQIMRDVILGDGPAPPSRHRGELSDAIDVTVTKALAKQKRDRYRGLQNFEQALRAIRTGRPLPQVVANQI